MSDYSEARASLFDPFVQYRIASNNWNDIYANNLLYFDRFCTINFPNVPGISQEMINGWCIQRKTENKRSLISRCQSAIRLVEYLRKRSLSEVTIPEMPPNPPRNYIPHAFSHEELYCFFAESDRLILSETDPRKRLTALGISVAFRLLYSSGMRTTEVRRLKTEHVDLQRGIINIKETKGDQQHYVVLHDDAAEMLCNYNSAAGRILPDRELFFPLNRRKPSVPISADMLDYHFHKIWDKVNESATVPYALRHNYAIENINLWIDAGFSLHDKFVYLSKSMGHTSLESTRYYYSLVPALADVLQEKTSCSFDEIIPEVPDYE